eukprot:TRINITY_DN40726_c0_g1_i2.p1 TRINITY_DN40726_c0_g1~~TRINITY_DN40726_c0_g1_i2.p1  ORF type:complete len:634 (-),score=113.62 TRINITY_DN40726_c0_g1_i2:70-1971(-)
MQVAGSPGASMIRSSSISSTSASGGRNACSQRKNLKVETWSASRRLVHRGMQSKIFETTIVAAVLFNMVTVVIETDLSQHDGATPAWLESVNTGLFVLYFFEMCIKLYVLREKFFVDPWNISDFCIVMLDVVSWGFRLIYGAAPRISILRVFRLARVVRALKAAIAFDELRLLIKGFIDAMKAIFWGGLMILLLICIWSIVAVQLIDPINRRVILKHPTIYEGCQRCPEAFSSVFMSSLTFFQQVVAGDAWGQVTLPIIEEEPVSFFFFMAVLFTVGMTMLNLILAVIVEKAQNCRDRKKMEEQEAQEEALKDLEVRLLKMCEDLDEDNDGQLSFDELVQGIHNSDELKHCLVEMSIDMSDLECVFSFLDVGGDGTISYAEFTKNMVQLRLQSDRLVNFFLGGLRKEVNSMHTTLAKLMEIAQTKPTDAVTLQAPVCVQETRAPKSSEKTQTAMSQRQKVTASIKVDVNSSLGAVDDVRQEMRVVVDPVIPSNESNGVSTIIATKDLIEVKSDKQVSWSDEQTRQLNEMSEKLAMAVKGIAEQARLPTDILISIASELASSPCHSYEVRPVRERLASSGSDGDAAGGAHVGGGVVFGGCPTSTVGHDVSTMRAASPGAGLGCRDYRKRLECVL